MTASDKRLTPWGDMQAILALLLAIPLALSSASGAENADQIARDLQTQLQALQQATNGTVQALAPIHIAGFNEKQAVDVYQVADVERFNALFRENLDRIFLGRHGLIPLRDYVEQNAPKPPTERFQSQFGPVLRARAGDDFFDSAKGLIQLLSAKARDLSISFGVESRPVGATFTLSRINGDSVRQVATNATLAGIYRGLYRYQINKQGFKPVKFDLDLVGTTPTRLVCVLHPWSSNDDPIPCEQ